MACDIQRSPRRTGVQKCSYGLFLDIRLFKKKILLFIFDQIVYPVISNEQNSFEFTLFNIKVSMLNNSVLLGKNVRYHVR
ncbi:unnamed protein product [Rhizophagus irregularis]|nr:unnamed protein product [Rhizophagus irregularis]